MNKEHKKTTTMNEDILKLVKGFIDYFEEVEEDVRKKEEDEG